MAHDARDVGLRHPFEDPDEAAGHLQVDDRFNGLVDIGWTPQVGQVVGEGPPLEVGATHDLPELDALGPGARLLQEDDAHLLGHAGPD